MNSINYLSKAEGVVEFTPTGTGPTPANELSAATRAVIDGNDDYGFDIGGTEMRSQSGTAKATASRSKLATPASDAPAQAAAAVNAAANIAPARLASTAPVWANVASRLANDLEAFRTATEAHREFVRGLHARGLSPGQARQLVEQAERSLPPDSTPDDLLAHSQRLATLKGISPAAVNQATKLVAERLDVLRGQAEVIITKADAILKELHSEAIAKESAFLAEAGLPHAQTALSRRTQQAMRELEQMKEACEHSKTLAPLELRTWTLDFTGILSLLIG